MGGHNLTDGRLMKFTTAIVDKTQAYFKPDPEYSFVLDMQFLAFLVGCVAVGLPVVMGIGILSGTCFFQSISHFYYAQFLGGVFVAALIIIGTFLLAYRGESKAETLLATIAGFSAFAIALFPTDGRGCEDLQYAGRILADQINVSSASNAVTIAPATELGQFFELFPAAGILHFASALALFLFLAFYSFFIFTRVIDEQRRKDGTITEVKKLRNKIYIGSGIVIVISVLAIGIQALPVTDWPWWNENKLTFWFEAAALWAFGISWMVKGRFYGYLLLDEREQATQK